MKNIIYSVLLALFLANNICLNAVEKKILFIPEQDIKKHGLDKADGNFGYEYKAESENIALLWDKSFGMVPETNPIIEKRFYPDEILAEAEKNYKFFIDKMKFVIKGRSNFDKYKLIIWMYNDDERTVYGGAHDKVGMTWFRPCRIDSYPYCALVHEMGHSFQFITMADGHNGFDSAMMEYTSQWMLWQLYPDWLTIENYHLNDYMKQTHLAMFHKDNMYHAPQFMEYWSEKHGLKIIGELWRKSEKGEDPVSTYMRVTGIDIDEFNDEVYDAASRFVTWDLPRIKTLASSYANEHKCKLEKANDGWYKIAKSNCPQSYGYNAIRLKVPRGGTEIKLDFKGIAGEEGFVSKETEKAGWTYGFVAVKQNGKRVYGKPNKAVNGDNPTVSFIVPEDTQFLWLVVTGAPNSHVVYKKDMKDVAEWPYMIKLESTSVL